jgi:regulator of CtrA degradation
MAEKLFDKQPVSFGARLAASQSFSTLFREGMKLVEETASYLDGAGRKESKKLDRSSSLCYATESMRLTTRLMQLASWLLLHRAVNEGEMSLAQANKEKTKVKLAAVEPIDQNAIKGLPEQLRDLIARSSVLHDKVRRLDATIHAPVPEEQGTATPLDRQLGLLKAAFERQDEPRAKP